MATLRGDRRPYAREGLHDREHEHQRNQHLHQRFGDAEEAPVSRHRALVEFRIAAPSDARLVAAEVREMDVDRLHRQDHQDPDPEFCRDEAETSEIEAAEPEHQPRRHDEDRERHVLDRGAAFARSFPSGRRSPGVSGIRRDGIDEEGTR
jgi:hypothetical protein